jgi:3',5'-cyclic AMP phosphodiesterase CpdA
MRAKRLLAISDLHLGHGDNRTALAELPTHRGDWLIIAGDVGETKEDLRSAIAILGDRFDGLIWVPGNHELWTDPLGEESERGQEKYQSLIEICRSAGVVTPEDPFPVWEGEGAPHRLVPLFLLYDYTFRPADVALDDAVAWARETRVLCADERYLESVPFPDRRAWCEARLQQTEERLAVLNDDLPTVLINHFPLRQDMAILPRIPRFCLWCGTTRTNDWHRRYRASIVVYGHLHIRTTQIRDQTCFEEVSLGYPGQWRSDRGVDHYLRQILPVGEGQRSGRYWR